jgi:hypothetical protein
MVITKSEAPINDLNNLLKHLPTTRSPKLVEIFSNIDNLEKSNELPILDDFLHQVLDSKATSRSVREPTRLDEIIFGVSSCQRTGGNVEFNPNPGTSEGFQQNRKHFSMDSVSSKQREIIGTFDIPNWTLDSAVKSSKLEEMISNYNAEHRKQHELEVGTQFTNNPPIVDKLNVNMYPDFVRGPSMSEEETTQSLSLDFMDQVCQKRLLGCHIKDNGLESLTCPNSSTHSELKTKPLSILEDLVKNPNSEYGKQNEKAVKSISTSKAAPHLKELIEFFDDICHQEETSAAPIRDQIVKTNDLGRQIKLESMSKACQYPRDNDLTCNTESKPTTVSKDVLVTTKNVEESTFSHLDHIIQSYTMSIGQTGNFATSLGLGKNAVFAHAGQLTKEYSKFALLQRCV